MLVLSRKIGQKIFIGNDICITITDVDRGKVRVGIEAPRHLQVLRDELKFREQNKDTKER